MQRTSLWMAFILVSLCFANSYAVSAEDSETDECWVIIKENYEWIHDDEEMVASHSRESNLSYDSQCRLIERTDTTYDMLEHKFIFYNEDNTISNSSLYWYDSDGDIIYLWQETFGYRDGDLITRSWGEYFENNGTYSLNQDQYTLYSYDGQGREILSNTSYGERFYTVETTYGESGNIIKVDSLGDGELSNSIEYEYNSVNALITETSTDYWINGQSSQITNYSYADSGKLVSKEQHDAGNNWTLYWNYTYDERGNKITEEFTRTGNTAWATITTFTWKNVIENTESSQESSSDDDDSSVTWLVILLAALILGTAYLVMTRSKVDSVRTLSGLDTDKVVEEILEEE